MLPFLENLAAMWSVRRDGVPTSQEFDRVGLPIDILETHAAELDAATPDFAQTRGKSWPETAKASKEFLRLLRELPDAAGPDAVIAHFRQSTEHRFR
jgi:hypothetical protein